MRKYFNYEESAEELNKKATKAVHQNFDKSIILNKKEITQILNCCLLTDRDYFRRAVKELWKAHDEARNGKYVKVPMSVDLQWEAVLCIKENGTTKEEFETMRLISRWYGVSRNKIKVFRKFNEFDEFVWASEGEEDESNYDGPEFAFDNQNSDEDYRDHMIDIFEGNSNIEYTDLVLA